MWGPYRESHFNVFDGLLDSLLIQVPYSWKSEVIACTNFGGTKRARDVPTLDVRYEFDDYLHTLKWVNCLFISNYNGFNFVQFRRIYQIAGSRGSRLIENLALADPQDYMPEALYIKKKIPPEIGHFFLIGTVTLSSLSTGRENANRQLCLRLMWETAPRAFSFISIVSGKRFLYIPSFQNGVTFSTMVYRSTLTVGILLRFSEQFWPTAPDQQKASNDSPAKTNFGPSQPRSRFSNSAQGYIPPGVDGEPNISPDFTLNANLFLVPIYDGRESSFKISDYTTSLERYHGEIATDTAVIVIFTVGWYDNRPEKRPANDEGFVFDTAVSLNIKSVIMVADASHDYTETSLPDEPLWGVTPLSTPAVVPVMVVEDGGDDDL